MVEVQGTWLAKRACHTASTSASVGCSLDKSSSSVGNLAQYACPAIVLALCGVHSVVIVQELGQGCFLTWVMTDLLLNTLNPDLGDD